MTGLLLDTHVLLWWAGSPKEISPEARLAIASGRNPLLFSYASIWELNIKISRGRLVLPESTEIMLQRARCHSLPITVEHIEATGTLPHHHGDPFDRMLIAQAMADRLTLVTRDRDIRKYDVPVITAERPLLPFRVVMLEHSYFCGL